MPPPPSQFPCMACLGHISPSCETGSSRHRSCFAQSSVSVLHVSPATKCRMAGISRGPGSIEWCVVQCAHWCLLQVIRYLLGRQVTDTGRLGVGRPPHSVLSEETKPDIDISHAGISRLGDRVHADMVLRLRPY